MKRRLYLFLTIYFLFVFCLFCYLPHMDSFVHAFIFMAVVYGLAFILLVALCVVILIASCIAGFLFMLLGYDDYSESTTASVQKADGLIPTLAVIIMIAIPAWILHCI